MHPLLTILSQRHRIVVSMPCLFLLLAAFYELRVGFSPRTPRQTSRQRRLVQRLELRATYIYAVSSFSTAMTKIIRAFSGQLQYVKMHSASVSRDLALSREYSSAYLGTLS
jgi:hypothetical protein